MKELVLFTSLLAVLLLAITGCSGQTNDIEKIVGSRMSGFAYSEIGYITFQDLVLFSDMIVIGNIQDIAEVKEEKIGSGDNVLSVTVTYYNVLVKETLSGVKSAKLVISLLGSPDSHVGMTKPNIGETLVLFLSEEHPESKTRAVNGFEKGLFRVSENGKVVSFSDEKLTAQYDGISVDMLKSEIAIALSGDFSEAFYSLFDETYQTILRQRNQQRQINEY